MKAGDGNQPRQRSGRQMQLINAIRVWLDRAIAHAEKGDANRAASAVKSAREILGALEQSSSRRRRMKAHDCNMDAPAALRAALGWSVRPWSSKKNLKIDA